MRIRDWDINLKIRLGGEAAFNVIFWTFFPFLSIYFTAAFGKGWTGVLLVLSQLLSVLANLVGGYCADRFGRKRMMVIAAGGQALGYGLFAIAASPWVDLPMAGFASFTLASLFGSLYWPASQAMVADVVNEKDQSNVFAIFYTAANMAVVVGPLLGSLLYSDNPYAVLGVAAAVCAALTLVMSRRLGETRPAIVAERHRTKDGTPWYGFITAQLRDYRVIATDRVFLLFSIAGVLLAQTFMQLDLLFPVFLKETVAQTTIFSFRDWDLTMTGQQLFGLIVSENGLFVAIFTVIVTKWMATYRDRYVFIGGALFYAAGMMLFSSMSTFWGFTAAIAVFTLAELMSAGPQQAFIARLAPEEMRGQYFAAASLRFTLGRTIAPMSIPLTGWIGFQWTFALLALLAVLSAGIYNVMFNRLEEPPRKTEAA
ncbi:MDR family MFS transporter [Paenibacillus sacheonensis]|uniref:MFS transporter n=1 Tax=Paenibacillus sacheonensis TaxID=742054 RepID=A0A7X4YQZ4_9BACL|nr:MFS transporter [Paenibacillus sacheonensis]MBM7567157.1 MFS family permease [Paenibacillus sacheonensis]NBC70918.1 MFS transporter [Paenibacillus sacheonensis]